MCDVETHFTRLRHRLKDPCTDRRNYDVPSSLCSPDVNEKDSGHFEEIVARLGKEMHLMCNN